MNVERGDVVLIDYPYSRGGGSKVRRDDVLRKLGSLPDATMRQIDECLKAALDIK